VILVFLDKKEAGQLGRLNNKGEIINHSGPVTNQNEGMIGLFQTYFPI
jgi:hypothetical protein